MSREEVVARAVETLAALPEVVGIALVGSGATGFRDEHSDLDLAVAVEPDAEPEEVARRWRKSGLRYLVLGKSGATANFMSTHARWRAPYFTLRPVTETDTHVILEATSAVAPAK